MLLIIAAAAALLEAPVRGGGVGSWAIADPSGQLHRDSVWMRPETNTLPSLDPGEDSDYEAIGTSSARFRSPELSASGALVASRAAQSFVLMLLRQLVLPLCQLFRFAV